MARLDKKWVTTGGVLASAILSACLITLISMPSFRSLYQDIGRLEKIRQEERALLAEKNRFQSEWDAKKKFLPSGQAADEVLSAWVKELLTLTQNQALKLEKMEPSGIKTEAGQKIITVFVSFQGDIREFIRFIYRLIEKDPLSRVESFHVRFQEDSKNLVFELMLGKQIQ